MNDSPPTTIDEYLGTLPAEARERVAAVRAIVHEVAPGLTERIAYQMPTFRGRRNVVHVAAMAHHVGLYPGASGIAAFADRFDALGFAYSKGAVQFPYTRPMPYDLIREIVAFRAAEDAAGAGGPPSSDPLSR
jgi:uncharacterized protein YdhG (YjbR/CyaY superfamily)